MPLSIEQESESLLQALDIRRALESHAAFLASRTATAGQLDTIRRALEAMERAHLRKGEAQEEDQRIHLAIYAAANNPLFEQIIAPVRGSFRRFFSQPSNARYGNSSFHLHRELYEAIARRDDGEARLKTLELLGHVEA